MNVCNDEEPQTKQCFRASNSKFFWSDWVLQKLFSSYFPYLSTWFRRFHWKNLWKIQNNGRERKWSSLSERCTIIFKKKFNNPIKYTWDSVWPDRKWNDNEIVAQCFLFFLAGFETSSTMLTFVAHELIVSSNINSFVHVMSSGQGIS